ncbi:hypothetical protein GW17_00052871 [Ensete ventricosum]|nr:hypothetical protein GW17_00052871 [Ensete ventricosum]RZR94510.1 hypothetical protein BHM03_00023219 [Ensete ventricosum]
MGAALSCHESYSRWDLYPGWGGPPLDLACIEHEKVLCLNDRLKTLSALGQFRQ